MSLNGLKAIGQEYQMKFNPKSGGIGSHRQFSLIMPPNYHELSTIQLQHIWTFRRQQKTRSSLPSAKLRS